MYDISVYIYSIYYYLQLGLIISQLILISTISALLIFNCLCGLYFNRLLTIVTLIIINKHLAHI